MHRSVRRLVADATQSSDFSGRVVLTTIFGDSLLPRRQEIGVQQLARLAAPLGLNERLVRTSLLRLTRESLVTAERRGRQSFYTVHPDAVPIFEDANRRIYGRLPDGGAWDGDWTIAVLDGSADRSKLQRARSELSWAGMRSIEANVLASPTVPPEAAEAVTRRVGVTLVALMRAPLVDGTIGRDDQRTAHLDPDGRLASLLARHRDRFAPLSTHAPAADPEDSFLIRTLLVDSWRRIALATPLFPSELLPDGWLGEDMYTLTKQLHADTFTASEQHLDMIMSPARARSLFSRTP